MRDNPRNRCVLDADMSLALIKPEAEAAADATTLKRYGEQQLTPGLFAVGAHSSPFSGEGVTVAVLDTGIESTHPAFSAKELVLRDFTGEGENDTDVRDSNGHGTHCAATVCGTPVGGVRVGVAPGVTRLCIGKVLGHKGGTAPMLIRGMVWAVLEQRASVVSLSLGFDLPGNTRRLVERGMEPGLASQEALRQQAELLRGISSLRAFLETQAPNVVFVAATGNESRRPKYVIDASLPASELLPVGAVGYAGDQWSVAPFSNGRAQLVAPGVDVISAAVGGGWTSMSGTSMATPHVAGVAALWTEKLRQDGGLGVPDAIRSAIKAAATRKLLAGFDVSAIGNGMVQAPRE
jgi:subtilisin family serine protease